jgi:hypothetical protein|eukprot:7156_1
MMMNTRINNNILRTSITNANNTKSNKAMKQLSSIYQKYNVSSSTLPSTSTLSSSFSKTNNMMKRGISSPSSSFFSNLNSSLYKKHNANQTANLYTSIGTSARAGTVTAAGILAAYISITAIVAMSPLDEFEKIDPKNDCYHRHLHPR